MIPRNQDLEAELAIRQLAASYTDAVNRGSAEDAAEIWAPGGVLVFYGREIRAEDLLEAYTKTFGAYELLFQMTHSGLVHVDGDRATARWWISEINRRHGQSEHSMFYGLYQDEVVRTGLGWRFGRRQLDAIARFTTNSLEAAEQTDSRPAFMNLFPPGPGLQA